MKQPPGKAAVSFVLWPEGHAAFDNSMLGSPAAHVKPEATNSMTFGKYLRELAFLAWKRSYTTTRAIMFGVLFCLTAIDSLFVHQYSGYGWIIVFTVLGAALLWNLFRVPYEMVNEREQKIRRYGNKQLAISERMAIITGLAALHWTGCEISSRRVPSAGEWDSDWPRLEADYDKWINETMGLLNDHERAKIIAVPSHSAFASDFPLSPDLQWRKIIYIVSEQLRILEAIRDDRQHKLDALELAAPPNL
jgi:hypothetical protein